MPAQPIHATRRPHRFQLINEKSGSRLGCHFRHITIATVNKNQNFARSSVSKEITEKLKVKGETRPIGNLE